MSIWKNYECEGQISLFEKQKFKIKKPIRLIELFAGVGSQAMALRDIGADFEHYRVVEFDKYAIASYNAIHGTDFPTMDVTKIKGVDLGIVDCDKFTYLLTPFLVQIYQLQERCKEWQKEAALGVHYCGKYADYLMKQKNCHKSLAWKMYHKCIVNLICHIFKSG